MCGPVSLLAPMAQLCSVQAPDGGAHAEPGGEVVSSAAAAMLTVPKVRGLGSHPLPAIASLRAELGCKWGGGRHVSGGWPSDSEASCLSTGFGCWLLQSPRLVTKKRSRPPRFKPREALEEEEMAAMPKFKARPLK